VFQETLRVERQQFYFEVHKIEAQSHFQTDQTALWKGRDRIAESAYTTTNHCFIMANENEGRKLQDFKAEKSLTEVLDNRTGSRDT